MKSTENDEPTLGLTQLTGCNFHLLSEALVDVVRGVSGAIREQMSASGAAGEICPCIAQISRS